MNYSKILQTQQDLDNNERKALMEAELVGILARKELLENDFYSDENAKFYEELETRELQVERELRLISETLSQLNLNV